MEEGGRQMVNAELDRIRRRLVAIDDELRALAVDDFAGKHRLNVEADGLRKQLRALEGDDSAVLAEWADRAARKSSDTADDDVEAAKAAIPSPSEGGGAV
ncbi:MAG: hypothetical protein AAF467_19180 [Actinomycetota bacterium]